MVTFSAQLVAAAFAASVIPSAYAQSSSPLTPPPEGVVGRQLPGFLTLQGPGSQIGASARDLTAAEAEQRGGDWFTSEAGVVIQEIDAWSPASRAGLMKGDVVTIFDGYRVRNVAHFTRLVGETPPGRTVKMTIVRNGKRQELSIIPGL